MADELADVVRYIREMEVNADPRQVAEVEQWIIDASEQISQDPAFQEVGDKYLAFEMAYGDELMGLLEDLGMLAEQTAIAQDPIELQKWERSLSSLINELNGGSR